MKVRLTRVERGFGREVYVWGRDEAGYKVCFKVEDFRPYVYVRAEEALSDSSIVDSEWGFQSVFGDELRKVYLNNPSEAPRIRDLVPETWEADIPYARRYAIDNHLQSYFEANEKLEPCESPEKPIPLRIAYLDIECYSESGQGMPDPVKDKVTCVTLVERYDGKTTRVSWLLDDVSFVAGSEADGFAVLRFTEEKHILEHVREIVNRSDCVVAWNLPFDLEYLEKRAKALGIPSWRLEGVCHLDLYEAYRKLYRRPIYKLRNIAVEEGFADKVDEDADYNDLYDNYREDLLALNVKHATWLAQIDEKRKITEYFWSLKELSGLENTEDTTSTSVLIDTMLLRRAKGALPTKVKKEHTTYEGAYVASPPVGVFESVSDFDMSAFYPNTIRSERLDPIILHAYKAEHPGKIDWSEYQKFAESWKGETIVLNLTEELMAMRYRMQREGHLDKVAAIKGIVNGLYGVLAYSGFRLHAVEIPERVTESARERIKALSREVESWGYKVLYNDTDSCWTQVPKESVKDLEARLNAWLGEQGTYTIKLENHFRSVVFLGAKKRYCGLKENGELEIVGFERVKSDSSRLTKDVQETVLRMILEARKAEIVPYLRRVVESVKTAKLEDVAVVKQLGKNLEEYDKGEQAYIKEIKRSKLMVKAGDSVSLVPASNYPFKVCCWTELSDIKKVPAIDIGEVVRTQVKGKVEDLLSVIGSSWDEVEGQARLI